MIRVIGTCEAGHVQTLELDPTLGMSYATTFAGLLDGSSPMYVKKPGPESAIGKCAWPVDGGSCGKQFRCQVEQDPPPESSVFVRKECIFNYCPHPMLCQDKCQNEAYR